jgi:hypothetical protein
MNKEGIKCLVATTGFHPIVDDDGNFIVATFMNKELKKLEKKGFTILEATLTLNKNV